MGVGNCCFRSSIPRGLAGYDGCTFTATLVGPAVEAAVDVYDIKPQRWSELFRICTSRRVSLTACPGRQPTILDDLALRPANKPLARTGYAGRSAPGRSPHN